MNLIAVAVLFVGSSWGQNFGPVAGVTTAATDLTNATIPAANVDAGTLGGGVLLGAGSKVPNASVDLSSVTTALAAKAASGANVDITSIQGVGFAANGGVTVPLAAVFSSSAPSYFNVSVATVAAGAAGAAVTVACPANSFVMYGGCNCTSTEVGVVTIIFNGPSGTWTAGNSATSQSGWKCQSAAVTTGQTCAAFVQCASIRN